MLQGLHKTRMAERQKKSEELYLQRYSKKMHDLEERNKMGSLLRDLEEKREKEKQLNNRLFYNKMKKLRQMIDRRAK